MEGVAMDCTERQGIQGTTASMQTMNINSVTPVKPVTFVPKTKTKREFEEQVMKLANGVNLEEEIKKLPNEIDESVYQIVFLINFVNSKKPVKKQKTGSEVVDERKIKNDAASTYIDNLIRSINNYGEQQDERDIVVNITKPNEADWSSPKNTKEAYGRYVQAANLTGVPTLLSKYYIGQVFNSRAQQVTQQVVAEEVKLSERTVQRYINFYGMALMYPGLLMSGYTYSNLLENRKVIDQAYNGGNQQAIDAFSRRLKSTVFAIEIEAPE